MEISQVWFAGLENPHSISFDLFQNRIKEFFCTFPVNNDRPVIHKENVVITVQNYDLYSIEITAVEEGRRFGFGSYASVFLQKYPPRHIELKMEEVNGNS